jgi:hypothetical protein
MNCMEVVVRTPFTGRTVRMSVTVEMEMTRYLADLGMTLA